MFLDGAEARVCTPCKAIMVHIDLGHLDEILAESLRYMQGMFTTNEDIQISLSPVNGLAVPSEQVEMVESPSASSAVPPALGLGALFAGLWRIVSWYNRDATVETDDGDIFSSDDIGLNWLMQELESWNEEDSNSIQGEDEQAPVDNDRHSCMEASDVEDENDERWEEIKGQFLSGLEQYLQDIKTNRENSTNSSEGNSSGEDHSTDQISEDDLSLDLDMTVQSAEFGHNTHTVTLRSLRPSEEHQKMSNTLREAGDGESEEDQIVEDDLHVNQEYHDSFAKQTYKQDKFRGSFLSLSAVPGSGRFNTYGKKKFVSLRLKKKNSKSLINVSEEGDYWLPAMGW